MGNKGVNYKRVLSWLLIGSGFLGATGLFAQGHSMRLSALGAVPGKPALYKLELNAKKALDPKSSIRLQFPAGYDLSGVKIAGSNDLAGGLLFAVDSTTITLRRTGLGVPFPANRNAAIIFGPIKQPQQNAKNDSVRIQIDHDAKGDLSNYVVKIQLR